MKDPVRNRIIKVKELREKNRMMKAVVPLVKAGVWTKDQFDKYCNNILESNLIVE